MPSNRGRRDGVSEDEVFRHFGRLALEQWDAMRAGLPRPHEEPPWPSLPGPWRIPEYVQRHPLMTITYILKKYAEVLTRDLDRKRASLKARSRTRARTQGRLQGEVDEIARTLVRVLALIPDPGITQAVVNEFAEDETAYINGILQDRIARLRPEAEAEEGKQAAPPPDQTPSPSPNVIESDKVSEIRRRMRLKSAAS
jgi:hypothetical protein